MPVYSNFYFALKLYLRDESATSRNRLVWIDLVFQILLIVFFVVAIWDNFEVNFIDFFVTILFLLIPFQLFFQDIRMLLGVSMMKLEDEFINDFGLDDE